MKTLGINICILLLIVVLTPTIAKAQQTTRQWQNDDTATINSILSEVDKNSLNQTEKVLDLINLALEKSKKINYQLGIVKALAASGDYYFANNLDKAISQSNEALQTYYAANLTDAKTKLLIYQKLAEAYNEKGRKDSSAYYFYLLNEELENNSITDAPFEINTYIKLSAFWVNMDYDSAFVTNKISRYLKKASESAIKTGDTASQSILHFLKAFYHYSKKEYDSCIYEYKTYLDKRKKSLSIARLISTNLNIADTYLLLHKPKNAMVYIDKVIALQDSAQYKESLAFFLMVANFFKAKALNQLKDYQASINLINATLKDVESTKSPMYSESIEAHNTIAEAYEKTGQYKDALYHKNLYLTLHDSLLRKDRLDMINQLEIRYQIAEKDKEITRQKLTAVEAENKIKSKNFLLASSFFAILLLSIIFVSWLYNSRNKQKLQQEKINNIQQKMEIENLSAAMNGEEKERTRIAHELHDGIGGLLTAAKLNFEAAKINASLNNSTEFHQGIHLLQEVSAELRNTAHHLMPEILLQGGLIEAVKYYTGNVLKSKQTEIVIQVLGIPKIFNQDFELAIYRIIQELLQNILKHAKAKNAIIQISYHEKDLAITVEDDGVGMPKNIAEKADGMGLTSIRERIKSIKGTMTINADPCDGTSIHLEFEYPNQKNEPV